MINRTNIIPMKKNILRLLVSLLIVITAQTHADWHVEEPYFYEEGFCDCGTNFYAKVFGGANFLQNSTVSKNRFSYDTGYILALSLGYRLCHGLRLEGEYAYRRNSLSKVHFYTEGSSKKGHFQTSSYMANLLWDLPLPCFGCTFWGAEPFIGAGIGYDAERAHASNSRVVFNQKWHRFAWQLMAGFAYPVYCNTEVTLEYKFHQGGCHFNNHSIGVGLLYHFNLR